MCKHRLPTAFSFSQGAGPGLEPATCARSETEANTSQSPLGSPTASSPPPETPGTLDPWPSLLPAHLVSRGVGQCREGPGCQQEGAGVVLAQHPRPKGLRSACGPAHKGAAHPPCPSSHENQRLGREGARPGVTASGREEPGPEDTLSPPQGPEAAPPGTLWGKVLRLGLRRPLPAPGTCWSTSTRTACCGASLCLSCPGHTDLRPGNFSFSHL